jgi:YidC/Oxa1 family membrane protein insertase
MNFKEWQRPVLLLAMAVVSVLLLVEWQKFQETRQPVIETTTLTTPSNGNGVESSNPQTSSETPTPSPTTTATSASDIPTPVDNSVPSVPTNIAPASTQLIAVNTDVLRVLIDPLGGDIVKVALPRHAVSIEQPNEPLILLNRTENTIYVAQSGLVGRNGTDLPNGQRPLFTSDKTRYELPSSDNQLQVDLHYQQGNVAVTKRFTFNRSDNYIDIKYLINNQSTSPWTANFYGQFKRDDHQPPKSGPGFGIQSFLGVATTTADERYKKYAFDDLDDGDFSKDFGKGFQYDGGWMAMVQHYFVSAWVPSQDQNNNFFARKLANSNQYLFGYTGPSIQVGAGEQGEINAGFYSGPKDIQRLEELAPYLDRTLDFSWLFFIARPMFLFLLWIHNFVANWGLAIILLVLCVKALFYPLASAGFRSMAKMKLFAPKMAELKERYGDNKQKFSEEMMKLYKKEGVNPVGGCLPMLLQIPVFISLYWVILEAVDLRHAPLIFWIQDLSAQDPFFILPLMYGVIMWFQQKLNPAMGDPTQQKIMQMMPIVFTAMFLFFPSGLVLYWVVNQLLSILQQWYITKKIEKAQGAKKT